MPLIRCDNIYSLTPQDKPLSIAFGNFDGVHIGHKKIIHSLNDSAKIHNELISALITFSPHPSLFFSPHKEEFLLFKDEQKFELLFNEGIKILYVIRFDEKFSKISAEEFIKTVVQNLNAKHITIGINCRFGNKASGDTNLIQNLASKYHYKASIVQEELLHDTGEMISSSYIRMAIKNGDVKKVSLCLGRFYFIIGKVIIGNKRGSLLGFPTCNLSLDGIIKPKFGVYFVRVEHRKVYYYGIANVGIRPTFNEKIPLIEVHILDFDKMIYGEDIKIELLNFIREEKKFSDICELQSQINKDVSFTKNHLIEKFHNQLCTSSKILL